MIVPCEAVKLHACPLLKVLHDASASAGGLGGAPLDDGRAITSTLYEQLRNEELHKLGGAQKERYEEAGELLDQLILNDSFIEFLTLPAYELLD